MSQKRVRLGRTELKVCRLGFGTIPLGNMPKKRALPLLHAALEAGINLIDVARIYGEAENWVGKALKEWPEPVVITSKGIRRNANEMAEDLSISCKGMGVEHIDIYFVHQVDTIADLDAVLAPDGAIATLEQAKTDGHVGAIGISSHFPAVLLRALETDRFDVILGRFNALLTQADYAVLKEAKLRDVGVLSMKVFEGGLLAGNRDLLLRHCFGLEGVHAVLIGIETSEQLAYNLEVMGKATPLDEAERKNIESMAAQMVEGAFCSACGYCAPVCPKGIPIPQIFNLVERGKAYSKDFGFYEGESTVNLLRDLMGAIGECDACGACLSRCPNRLSIPERLKEIREHFDKLL